MGVLFLPSLLLADSSITVQDESSTAIGVENCESKEPLPKCSSFNYTNGMEEYGDSEDLNVVGCTVLPRIQSLQ